MKKLRIAVIGTGGIAHVHLNGYATKENVEIVGLSDMSPERLKATAQEHPAAPMPIPTGAPCWTR